MSESKAVRFWNDRNVPKDFPWLPVHERLWEAMGSRPGMVLDLAAGTGALSIPLLQKECVVTAVELAPKLVAHLETVRSPSGQKMTVIPEDVRTVSLPEEMFDLVICSFILHFLSLEEGRDLLVRIGQSLKSGGLLLLRWMTAEGELEIRYDRFVPMPKDMLRYFPNAEVLFEERTAVDTAMMRTDGTPKQHVAVALLLRR